MRTNEFDQSNVCQYDKQLAYEDYMNDTIYVFTDITAKRFKADPKRYKSSCTKYDLARAKQRKMKVIFVTNKHLKDLNHRINEFYFARDFKELVFDAKFGTGYRSEYKHGSCCGTYFHCLRKDMYSITAR